MKRYVSKFEEHDEDDYFGGESITPQEAVEIVMTGNMLRKKPKTSEERIIAYYNILEQEGFTNGEIVEYAHKFFKYNEGWIIETLRDSKVWRWENR